MEPDYPNIEKEIRKQTIRYYQNKNVDLQHLFDLLEGIFQYPVDPAYKLNGVSDRIPEALNDITSEDSSKKMIRRAFVDLCKYEPFLRKILLMIKPDVYQQGYEEKKGLAWVLKKLQLSGRIDFNNETAQANRTYDQFDYHMYITYNLRNTESHQLESWQDSTLMANAESIYILYLTAIERNLTDLESVLQTLNVSDYQDYLQNLIDSFTDTASRFIHLSTREDLHVLDSYVSENTGGEEAGRTGTIEQIRSSNLPENRMLIWADAGMGKTTSLNYLAYRDALDFISDAINILPVFLPLGMLADPNETIIARISAMIGTDSQNTIRMLRSGKIHLFLDAVNEVPQSMQDIRRAEIQQLLNSYPQTQIIISERGTVVPTFTSVPVFRLQKMNEGALKGFIMKNAPDDQVRNEVLKQIETRNNLKEIMSTPLMATRCLEIARTYGSIPSNEGLIIGKYLQSLMQRELTEKKNSRLDGQKLEYLLAALARHGLNEYGTNSAISRQEVLGCFDAAMKRLHFEYDSLYALEIADKLGIITVDSSSGNTVFAHQMYQDYYNARAIDLFDLRIPDLSWKDSTYSQTVIYHFHGADASRQIEELTAMARESLVVAAQALITGDFPYSYSSIVINKALQIGTDAEFKDRLSAIIALSMIHEDDLASERIIDLIGELAQNNSKINRSRLSALFYNTVPYLKGSTILKLTEYLAREFSADSKLIYIIYVLENYQRDFKWNQQDVQQLIRIQNCISDNSVPKYHYRFCLAFNVPKEAFVPPETITMTALFTSAQMDIFFRYLNRYDLPRDDKDIYNYFMRGFSSKRRHPLDRLLNIRPYVSHSLLITLARRCLKGNNNYIHDYLVLCLDDPHGRPFRLNEVPLLRVMDLPGIFTNDEALEILESLGQ